MSAATICLVTPGHVASTPRLVKEATALAEAGYQVHVVAGRHFPPADRFDAAIFANARWRHTLVDSSGGAAAFVRKVLHKFSRPLVARLPRASIGLAARAHHAQSLRFASVAASIPALLYHGHCLAALPAVARAAQRRSARYGFDLEDFHDAETKVAANDIACQRAARLLQSALLPGCAVLTAAAPLIAQKIAEAYRVEPRTLLNVFPRSEAPAAAIDPAPITGQRPARFYWFSQTVGAGRGLEATIAILARLRTPAELQLRGLASGEYVAHLNRIAARAGLKRPIQFLPRADADEMARLAAGADLGLSTEESTPLNRDVCLTNKIFTYLLAGIPQVLSRTSAQVALAPELGDAALLCDLGRVAESAQKLDVFLADASRVRTSRKIAWDLAQRRFCWDEEKKVFVDLVRQRIGPPA